MVANAVVTVGCPAGFVATQCRCNGGSCQGALWTEANGTDPFGSRTYSVQYTSSCVLLGECVCVVGVGLGEGRGQQVGCP